MQNQQFFKRSRFYLLTLLSITFLASCSLPKLPQNRENTTPEPLVNPITQSDRLVDINPTDPNFVVTAVQKVGSAVVRINAARTVSRQTPNEFDDPRMGRFFGSAPSSKRVERGTGSGFIVNANGQILTNSHVVNGADTVSVTLKDGRTFKGEVLGEDPVTDVAVIKIEANDLPIIPIGNSDGLRPGEWVIAIGNPLGLDNTVTAGIVSATDRSSSDIGVSDKRVGFIQTDAAINPGNSGGPLLNARGEVIGMNTAIISGAQGLGFAIPINTVQGISQQIITKGKVEHAYLGVQMLTLTPEVKEQLNTQSRGRIRIEAEKGILLVRVVPNSPADDAGLQAGDVVQSINNQPVTKTEQVQQLVESSNVGSQLKMKIQRGQKIEQVSVKLESLPTARDRS
ncbi:HhoA/HhoB/HtrA family serine endopeptidase [Chlorogloea sp. CCALA 695]|uniref:HhoA/HhoB/HtrA family serine endopeptidase n=1 Tax=Chlorogloea sp. CCALA 695 TaxID=2107693 RepID=UPI000D064FF6|nr:HhoA/HhoB/HtrA family serine endopeptidase [Chlorogloea sp. CCALA 695]PSB27439.1 serine protease [Chlorogloea sp. CCALA 695]